MLALDLGLIRAYLRIGLIKLTFELWEGGDGLELPLELLDLGEVAGLLLEQRLHLALKFAFLSLDRRILSLQLASDLQILLS